MMGYLKPPLGDPEVPSKVHLAEGHPYWLFTAPCWIGINLACWFIQSEIRHILKLKVAFVFVLPENRLVFVTRSFLPLTPVYYK